MQSGKLIQEQPGLGVGWPLDSTGRVAPIVLPGGEKGVLPRWSLDSSGNVQGLVSPSGSIVGSVLIAPSYVALIGDSTIQQNTNAPGGAKNTADRGSIAWALTFLGHPWEFLHEDNLAVGGTTLSAVISSQLPNLMTAARSRRYSRVFLAGGTNDTNSGRSVSDIQADFVTIFGAIRSIGAIPAVLAIRPRGADGSLTAAKAANIWLNEWLASIALTGAIEFIDASETFADNSAAFGNCLASLMYDSVLHPNARGAYLEGKVISAYYTARGFGSRFKVATQQGDVFDRTNNPYGIVFASPNPLLQGGATAPTGMTTSGGSWSKVSRTLPNGQSRSDAQCALTSSTTHYLYDDLVGSGAWTASQLQPGDIIEARAIVDIASGVNLNNVNIQLNENDGTTGIPNYGMAQIDNGIPNDTVTLYLKTPRVTVRDYSGSGNVSVFARVNIVTGGTASGTVTVKAFEVRRVA